MNPMQALKLSSAQLELDARSHGGFANEQGYDSTADIDSEWGEGTAVQHQSSGRASARCRTYPPAQSIGGTTPFQDSVDPSHEDPTAALLSGMLFQQLSESRGGVGQSSENMAATIKNVLIATGIAVDDADIDAPLDYVEEMFAQLGLGISSGSKGSHGKTAATESTTSPVDKKVQDTDNRSPTPTADAEQLQGEDCHSEATPTEQPQQPHQHSSHGGMQQPQTVPDCVTRVPTAPSGQLVGGADMPPPCFPAGLQQRHVPGTAQVIRHVQHNPSAQHVQHPHLVVHQQSLANAEHSACEMWDAAARPRSDSGNMRPESLTQVAAAAAVAAAQAVKSDSDSELSQVLKAVLFQQSSLGMQRSALAAQVTGPASAGMHCVHAGVHAMQHPATPLQAPPSIEPVVRSLSRVPQPFSATPNIPPSIGASNLAPQGSDNALAATTSGDAPPEGQLDLQQKCFAERSQISDVHTATVPELCGAELKGNDQGVQQSSSKAKHPRLKSSRGVPNRLKGTVSSTVARMPTTRPSTPSTWPASTDPDPVPTETELPAAARVPLARVVTQQPAHSDEPPLQPAFKASVDAARASVCPELAAVRPALELPHPDFTGKARSNLKRMLGAEMSYIDLKCTARSAAAEAHNELMAFKRSVSAVAPLVPTRMLPSWHSMEAMDDVGVFADACVQEVALRAAQVQSDVSDGVYDLSHARARTFRSQAAARSLHQLTAKQNLAIAASEEKDGSAVVAILGPSAEYSSRKQGANRTGATSTAAPGEKRARVNPGRKAVRSVAADERSDERAPLYDGMNVKRGEMDTAAMRSQAAYERAVDRSRARPPIAFGRRLEDTSRGEVRSDVKENVQDAVEPGTAAAHLAAAGRRATGRLKGGVGHTRSPDGRESQGSDRQEERVPHQIHQRGGQQRVLGLDGGDSREQHEATEIGWAHGVDRCRPSQRACQVDSVTPAHSAAQPSSGSTATDAALVALLQGLTRIIRTNSLTHTTPVIHVQPAWPAHAVPVPSQQQQAPAGCQHMHAGVPNEANAVLHSRFVQTDAEIATVRDCKADQPKMVFHADTSASHAPATSSSAAAVAEASLQDNTPSPQSSVAMSPQQHSTHRPTVATVAALAKHLASKTSRGAVHPRSASATAAWATLGCRTPPKFLSVVDIAAPSTDLDCSSDGGYTSHAPGEFPHGVDMAALEQLIAASTRASEQGDGQNCPVQLTQEEASMLKAVVRDLTAAHSTASTRRQQNRCLGVDAGEAAAGGEELRENLSEAAPCKQAESVLTMKQSPHQGSGSNSQGSVSQSRDGGTLPCDDVVALPAEQMADSALLATSESGTRQHDASRGDIEAEHGSACGGRLHDVCCVTEITGSDGTLLCTPSGTRHEQASRHVQEATNNATAPASTADEHGYCQDQLACEQRAASENRGAECTSMAHCVSSRDPGISDSAQLDGESTHATLQERIKERYAELREQTKAALEDSSSCDHSPQHSVPPRAPALHRRCSNSPETPTDLSIASLSFDPSHAFPRSGLARPPPLASSTENSVRSSDAANRLVQNSSSEAHHVAICKDGPATVQVVVDGPFSAPLRHTSCSQHHECPVEGDCVANTVKSSGHQHASEQHPQSHHSLSESQEDAMGGSSIGPFTDSRWGAGCTESSAAVDKDGGVAASSDVQELVRPLGAVTDDWKISSARPGLDQYADLRCRLWRPPDDAQIFAAAVDFGQPSDVSGYCTEDSKYMSSTCADPPEHQPLALDRSLLRRRRLDRLKRRLKQESSFATTTSLASSSDITASMSHESDRLMSIS